MNLNKTATLKTPTSSTKKIIFKREHRDDTIKKFKERLEHLKSKKDNSTANMSGPPKVALSVILGESLTINKLSSQNSDWNVNNINDMEKKINMVSNYGKFKVCVNRKNF